MKVSFNGFNNKALTFLTDEELEQGDLVTLDSEGKLVRAEQGDAFSFCGYTGKPAGYMILFSYCAVAYIVGWCFMKGLVPKYKKVEL